jgi:hypothetical protein
MDSSHRPPRRRLLLTYLLKKSVNAVDTVFSASLVRRLSKEAKETSLRGADEMIE